MSTIDFEEALAPLEAKNTARMTLYGVKVNSAKDVVLIGVHSGATNEKCQSLTTKLTKKHQTQLAAGGPDATRLVNELFAQVFAKTVITDWENVCEKGGKEAACTPELCEQFLIGLQKKWPELANFNGRISDFFSTHTNFCDGYVGDIDTLGEG
jgi:hypothetical protein